jgi:hypothetical protein
MAAPLALNRRFLALLGNDRKNGNGNGKSKSKDECGGRGGSRRKAKVMGELEVVEGLKAVVDDVGDLFGGDEDQGDDREDDLEVF